MCLALTAGAGQDVTKYTSSWSWARVCDIISCPVELLSQQLNSFPHSSVCTAVLLEAEYVHEKLQCER